MKGEDGHVKAELSDGKLGVGGRVRERYYYYYEYEYYEYYYSLVRRGRRRHLQDRIVRWKARRRWESSKEEDLLEAGSSAQRGRRQPCQKDRQVESSAEEGEFERGRPTGG